MTWPSGPTTGAAPDSILGGDPAAADAVSGIAAPPRRRRSCPRVPRMSIRQPVSRAASRAFSPARPIASESCSAGTSMWAVRLVGVQLDAPDRRRGQRAHHEVAGSADQATICTCSLPELRHDRPLADALAADAGPLGVDIVLGGAQTATFERRPGSRAIARISTWPVTSSGTSRSSRRATSLGRSRDHDLGILVPLADADHHHLEVLADGEPSPGICSSGGSIGLAALDGSRCQRSPAWCSTIASTELAGAAVELADHAVALGRGIRRRPPSGPRGSLPEKSGCPGSTRVSSPSGPRRQTPNPAPSRSTRAQTAGSSPPSRRWVASTALATSAARRGRAGVGLQRVEGGERAASSPEGWAAGSAPRGGRTAGGIPGVLRCRPRSARRGDRGARHQAAPGSRPLAHLGLHLRSRLDRAQPALDARSHSPPRGSRTLTRRPTAAASPLDGVSAVRPPARRSPTVVAGDRVVGVEHRADACRDTLAVGQGHAAGAVDHQPQQAVLPRPAQCASNSSTPHWRSDGCTSSVMLPRAIFDMLGCTVVAARRERACAEERVVAASRPLRSRTRSGRRSRRPTGSPRGVEPRRLWPAPGAARPASVAAPRMPGCSSATRPAACWR